MIGIITRLDKSPTNKDIYTIYKKINDVVTTFDNILIPILPNKIEKIKLILDNIDGIILQGGDDYNELDLEIIKYIYDNNIPCLGICLGMQTMSYLFNGEIKKLSNLNHYLTEHEVKTNNSSIYKDKIIKVNSRHKYYVSKTNLEVTGRSMDNIIEMVEDKNKDFFIGVEWHPEDIYKIDENAYLLFKIFFDNVNKKRLKKKENML